VANIQKKVLVRVMMVQTLKRSLLGALILGAPFLTACERVDDVMSIDRAPVVDQMIQQDLTVAAKRKKLKLANAAVSKSGQAFGVASRHRGVKLEVDGFTLVVPRNAVHETTVFYMTVVPGNSVRVILKAYAGRNEVKSFREPLQLTMPLSAVDANQFTESSKLVLAEIDEDDGDIRDVVNVFVDTEAGTVTGHITHFSIWALAFAKEIIVGID
jgi:hypothetical protein